MNLIDIDKYIDATTAAKILNVTRATISTHCKNNRFSGAVKIGHFWLIPRKEIENFTRQKPGAKSNAEIQALINEAVANALKQKEQEEKQTTEINRNEQCQQLEMF